MSDQVRQAAPGTHAGHAALLGRAAGGHSCCIQPAPIAASCASIRGRCATPATRWSATWVEASGRGTVHSWTVTHHPFHAGFKGELPYILATVDLAEGVRMNAQVRGIDPAGLRIGLPVQIGFETATEGLNLPVIEPAG